MHKLLNICILIVYILYICAYIKYRLVYIHYLIINICIYILFKDLNIFIFPPFADLVKRPEGTACLSV